MRFAELEHWGTRNSVLHRRDARAKIAAALMILIATSRGSLWIPAFSVAMAIATARLPVVPVLLRGAVVLPFSLSFALASLHSGNAKVAGYVLLRSYISAICVIVLLGCTPLASILDALRRLGAPPFLLDVTQFVYRYLTLIGEQSRRMMLAASARGARRSIAAVAGSIGVLFARSYHRAEAIHRSMLARGFNGSLMPASLVSFTAADALLLCVSSAVLVASIAWHR